MNSVSRRQTLLTCSALLLPAIGRADGLEKPLAALERRVGGRLGVAVLDTATRTTTGHRADERFGMCSTFKLPLAAVILREIERGHLRFDQFVPYTKADFVPHTPVTGQHLADGGMTVGALAEAAQTTSDNLAANLLLQLIGGPAGLTRHLRELGDPTTRIDRIEPAMNIVLPGELHDTTTPAAMAATVARITVGDALAPASRERLLGWMEATDTGLKRLRAGFPAGWRAGDKTGTFFADGMAGKYNDLAITWPLGRAPLIVTAFYETATPTRELSDSEAGILAEVGRIAAAWQASTS